MRCVVVCCLLLCSVGCGRGVSESLEGASFADPDSTFHVGAPINKDEEAVVACMTSFARRGNETLVETIEFGPHDFKAHGHFCDDPSNKKLLRAKFRLKPVDFPEYTKEAIFEVNRAGEAKFWAFQLDAADRNWLGERMQWKAEETERLKKLNK